MTIKLIARNKKAFHDYEVVEKIEAGLALQGTEVKALREGRINLKDSHAKIRNGEMWLVECHISPYTHGNIHNHDPIRPRKLLLHGTEIRRLIGQVSLKGRALIPLALYVNRRGRIKVEVGLCQGKHAGDKRESLRRRDADREAERALAARRRA